MTDGYYELHIKTNDEYVANFYREAIQKHTEKIDGYIKSGKYGMKAHYMADSGFDLVVPKKINRICVEGDNCFTLDHQVQAALYKIDMDGEVLYCSPYYLYPRSSISKTNFRLANSVGIIDSGYRGNLMAKIDIIGGMSGTSYTIDKGSRLFQICTPTLEPIFHVKMVDHLEETERGEGAFGSTGGTSVYDTASIHSTGSIKNNTIVKNRFNVFETK